MRRSHPRVSRNSLKRKMTTNQLKRMRKKPKTKKSKKKKKSSANSRKKLNKRARAALMTRNLVTPSPSFSLMATTTLSQKVG